ncbi:MAG TPA: FAD-dependent oxidoreductase, partial [Acidimicrobiales bacterium]
MADRVEADVCVVGAGYAGLTAALRLHQNGKSVVVLEARHRIGGRIWTQHLPDGSLIDRGGAWLAPRHDAIFGLTREFGVATYKTWVKGSHLLVHGGEIRRYKGLIPKISPLAVLSIALNQARIDRMSKRVPLDAPWTAPRAEEWDARTVAWWLERSGIRSTAGRDLFEMAVRGLFTGDLNDTSFLHLLFLVRGHGSINALFSITGGAQENMFDGGAGLVAERMAAVLGDAVRLGTPARSISHGDDRVTVEAEGLSVSARHCVVTVPPALTLGITFDPPLPDDRRTLYEKAIAGPESKTLIVYDKPFWRADGFSGQSAEPGSTSEVTLDATSASGTPGVLASFTFGPVAERAAALDPDERRRAVLGALSARFGERAGSPREFVETAWWTEEWTKGCSMAHFPPGLLTRYGHLLRQPLGRLHWAGTE